MRYLIVTYDDYFNIPYIRYYEEFLTSQGQPYDIVLWNRSGKQVDIANAYIFYGKDSHHKLGKIRPFLQWRQFVLSVLRKNKYDRLILLTTMPAVLLADKLLGEYRSRFWLDIRDFTYENVGFYARVVHKLVHAAAAVSISSPAFQRFLPESDHIYLTHNISNQHAEEKYCTLNPQADRYCIGFVGGIQFAEQNKQLLTQFANREKYLLKYVGKAHLGCDLPSFCKENNIGNAEFYPTFQNHEKPEIYRDIQLINCVYGNHNQVVRLLLPNRLYDCVLFKKPILVSKGTYLADVIQEYNLGFAVDLEHEDVVKCTEAYLAEFNREAFETGCQLFLERVNREIQEYMEALSSFCNRDLQ